MAAGVLWQAMNAVEREKGTIRFSTLLNEVLVISRIIKVKVGVISKSCTAPMVKMAGYWSISLCACVLLD